MKTLLLEKPKVAFYGRAEHRLHAPSQPDWAEARFFEVPAQAGTVPPAGRGFSPDVSVIFDPANWSARSLQAVKGLRVGVVDLPLFDPAAADRLRAHCVAGLLDYLTVPDAGTTGLPPDRVWGVLPPPVDFSQLPAAPSLENWRVCVPAWALPDAGTLEALEREAQLTVLPAQLDLQALTAQLAEHGVLVYCTRDALGRFDPLPRIAMALGLLVVSGSAFPSEQGIEPEDEFLETPQLATTVAEVRRLPLSFRAVRIRARQKMRESFDADAAFKRVVHDVRLFADDGLEQRSASDAVVVPLKRRLAR